MIDIFNQKWKKSPNELYINFGYDVKKAFKNDRSFNFNK